MNAEVKPGYKVTEAGVIPEDWGVFRLAELLEEGRHIRYGVVQPGTFVSDGCFMLRSQDYSRGWSDENGMHRLSKLLETQFINAKLRAGDIVMTVVGAGIGQIDVIPKWLEGAVLSRSTARIAVDEHKAEKTYVKYYLESPVTTKQLRDCQKEGAQPVVSCPDLSGFVIACPPRLQQNAIATILTDMDALISGLERLIVKKRDIKQATMQQLLTGQQRLPGFGGDWKVRRLGELAHIKTGSRNNQDKTEDGQYPFFVRSATIERVDSFSFDCEAILVPGEGNIGSIFHYINGRFDVHQRVYAIAQFAPDTSGKFVYLYMTMHFGTHAMQNSVKATVDSLRLPTFQNFEITLPPSKDEQTAIATILSDIENELSALETRCEKARQLKQGMMQELLTGRIRLSQSSQEAK